MKQTNPRPKAGGLCISKRQVLEGQKGLVLLLAVLLAELLDTTGGVDELHLAGVEGVGGAGDFQLHQGVFVAVFPLDGFLAVGAGFAEEGMVRGNVLEDNGAVALGVDVLSHRRRTNGIFAIGGESEEVRGAVTDRAWLSLQMGVKDKDLCQQMPALLPTRIWG